MGERVVEESARAIIREQAAGGGRGVPWIDPTAFRDLTARRDVAIFDCLAGESGRIFFDRGIPDSHGVLGAAPSAELARAIRTRRYNRQVFVFPPWAEIYETDAERKQDWAEAEATYGRIMSALPALGYAPIVVPKADVESRAAFVMSVVLQAPASPP
jgi:predicted ATPase